MRRLRTSAGIIAVASTAVLTAGYAASASPPPVSQLQVTAATHTIDMAGTGTLSVTVKLDDTTCPTVFGAGQTYGIAAISSTPSVATVPSNTVSGLQCGGSGAAFLITGHANGTSTIRFDPVANAPGLQKKLAGVNFAVTVINAQTDGNGGPPPAHKRPAAPAVANAYLNDAGLKAACQSTFSSSGHAWRGAFIRSIAKWSADNKLSTKKDNTTLYPSDDNWIHYVQLHVDSVCGFTPTP